VGSLMAWKDVNAALRRQCSLLRDDALRNHFRLADHPGVIAWGECRLRHCGVLRLGPESELHFAVDRLNQGLDVPVTERERLETSGIVRMSWHVVWTDRA
jgi:hypothetical protein